MKKSNSRAANPQSQIQCVEVLVSKESIFSSGHNLHWTLSVYSLENAPAKRNLPLSKSEVFHFMVYDWIRTLKQMLDDHQVPYSIVQFFTPDSLFPATPGKYGLQDDEHDFLAAIHKLENLPDDRSPLVAPPHYHEEQHAPAVLSDGNF
jgi:hypothetical protein